MTYCNVKIIFGKNLFRVCMCVSVQAITFEPLKPDHNRVGVPRSLSQGQTDITQNVTHICINSTKT